MPEIDLQQVIKDQAGINEKLSEAVGVLQAQLRKAEDVILFYADESNWDESEAYAERLTIRRDARLMKGHYRVGGKKAREYLAKLNSI